MSLHKIDGVKTLKLWDWGYDRASDYDCILSGKDGNELTRIRGGWFKKKIVSTVSGQNLEKIETSETDTTITFKKPTKCQISDEKPEEEEGVVKIQCSVF